MWLGSRRIPTCFSRAVGLPLGFRIGGLLISVRREFVVRILVLDVASVVRIDVRLDFSESGLYQPGPSEFLLGSTPVRKHVITVGKLSVSDFEWMQRSRSIFLRYLESNSCRNWGARGLHLARDPGIGLSPYESESSVRSSLAHNFCPLPISRGGHTEVG